MIKIQGSIEEDVEKAILFFEPVIRNLTNNYVYNVEDREDCKQILRLKIWKLHSNPSRVFNEYYIATRMLYDTLNFISRDPSCSWNKMRVSLESLKHRAYNDVYIFSLLQDDEAKEKIENQTMLVDIIEKSRHKLNEKQYESLVLFLSGANGNILKNFYGVGGPSVSGYYLYITEAINIIRDCLKELGELGEINEEIEDEGSPVI